jgi:predicted ATPase
MNKLIADRFEIHDPEKDLLGRGGMGEVYRATDTQNGEIVAIKALNPQFVDRDPEILERFVREGAALRQLNHPNIVRMVTALEEDGLHYLVMEYVGGGSLEDLLERQGRLPAGQVVEIVLDLADALTRAHRLGILHRDLKPANVLLAENGTPRLADFGIAHMTDIPRLTQTGVLVGTIDYLSPEVCQGEPPDERSDIWSFGVLLYQMLTGQLPFGGKSLTAKITAILTQPVPDLTQSAPDTPDALADLIYRTLEKDPQQRIPSVRLVGAELEAIQKGREISPLRPSLTHNRFAIPTPAPDAPKHNLPVQTTPFVGRQEELCELARLLAGPDVRLVTILGVGGMGKTRLAIEAGAAQLGNFVDGIYFISLAPVGSIEAIVPTIAQTLGFSFYEGAEPRQELLGFLQQKNLLLILDNFEHLLEGVDLVSDILTYAQQVKILTTTRLRLNVYGEQLFQLEGLDFPDWETPAAALEYSAVKLFLQSARRVRPGFELSEGNLKYVARICRLVGGMPLGILLAAAWVETLTPEEIAIEMQRSLDFLETDQRGIPERQHSLRAVFDYSWGQLTGSEQEVFKGLSVFNGGFTRSAAQYVTGASLRDMMSLVSKSLLHRASTGRFEMHELLHQYATDQLHGAGMSGEALAEEHALRDRHCAYYGEFLQQREAQLVSKEQIQVLPEIIPENGNLRAAWDWAVTQGRITDIDHLLEGLAELFRILGWLERGEEIIGNAVQRLLEDQKEIYRSEIQLISGKAILWQARFCYVLGQSEKADWLFQRSLDIFRELGARSEAAYALSYFGGSEGLYGSDSPEEGRCLEACAIFKEIGDQRGTALALRGLAWAKLHQGDYIMARDLFQDSLALFREVNNRGEIINSLGGLGYISWILGEYHEAVQLHHEMLSLCREINDQGGIARALGDLGIDSYGLQDWGESKRLFQESLAMYKDIGHKRGIMDELGDLGECYSRCGEYLIATQYAQQCLDIYRQMYGSDVSWPLRVLGVAACEMGDLSKASHCLRRALELEARDRRFGHILLAITGIALLHKAKGEKEKALELLVLVFNHPISWQMTKDWAEQLITELETELPPNFIAAAHECGRARNLEATVAELLVELGE